MADEKFSQFPAVADPAGGEIVGLSGGDNARFPASAFATGAEGDLATSAVQVVAGTAPIVSTPSGTTRTISITTASAGVTGAISGTDYNRLANTSGTNTGDQTSIVGITGTLAEFNTALTGADFATGGGTVTGASSGTNTGDNAVNSLYSGLVSNANHSGDATGDTALTLQPAAITGKATTTIDPAADYILFSDTSNSGALGKTLASAIGGGSGTPVTISDNGTPVTTAVQSINFVGATITEPTADNVTVTISSSGLTIEENTVDQADAPALNFTAEFDLTNTAGVRNTVDLSTANKASLDAADTAIQTSSSLGAGTTLVGTPTSTNLTFKTLVEGTNITLSNDADTVTINASSNVYNTVYIDQTGGTSDTYGVLTPTPNGVLTVFTVSQGLYATGTLKVYRNGQLQTQGSASDWTETIPASGTFTFAVPPLTTDEITVEYQEQEVGPSAFVYTGNYLPRLAICGASIVNRGSYSNTASQGYGPHNWTQWLLAMCGHRLDIVSMAGVGGRQISTVDANFDTEVGAYTPDVVILGSDSAGNWLYQLGGRTAAQALAYVQSIHTKCKALNARLIVFTLPPNGNCEAGNDPTFAKTDLSLEYNRLLANWASSEQSISVVDFSGHTDVAATDGRYQTTTGATTTTDAWTHDGTHPQPRMSIRLARILLDALNIKDLPQPYWLASPCNSDASRAFINPVGIGTAGTKSGGCTGDVADNWTLTAAATSVGSKVARTDLGPNATWQNVVSTAATASPTLAIAGRGAGQFPAGVTVGTPVMAMVEVLLNAAPTNLRGIQAVLSFNGTATTHGSMNTSSAGGFAQMADAGAYIPIGESYWIGTAIAAVPASATGVSGLTLTFAKSSAGNLTSDISIGRVVMIPKDALPNVVSAENIP